MSEEIKAKAKRRAKLPSGMVLRGRTYHADFMKNGRRIRKRLSSDLKAATEMLNALRHRADKADFDLLDNRYPWAELRKDFRAWAKLSVRDWKEYEADLDKFEEFCKVTCVSMVTPQLINQFREWRKVEVTPRTINRQVGTIRNMLGKGVHLFKVIASNPLADVKRLDEGDPTKERRALELDEVEAIFQHAPADLKPMLRLYCTTGMRRDEVVELRFDDVDWENQSITVRRSLAKGKKVRDIPLDDETMAMLIELREQAAGRPTHWNHEYVFVNQIGNPHRHSLLDRFYAVCKRAGIEDAVPNGAVDLHALRATFITQILRHGGSVKDVQAIVGHSTPTMTMNVYAKTNDGSKRAAINMLPYAKASSPKHLVNLEVKRAELSQDSHKCPEGTAANVG